MSKKTTEIEVHASSGNVFEDLKLTNSGEALVKADIAHKISSLLAKRGLTQVQAAKLLGIDQPKVSALLRGQLRGFSTERLLTFVNALGHDVEIAFRPKSRSHARGMIRVLKKVAAGTR
jgi:predicted XRE-type DNA-binding protein